MSNATPRRSLLAAKRIANLRRKVPTYDWLESDGKAYVELPIRIGSDLVFDFVYMAFPSEHSVYGYVFGGYNGWSQTSPASRYSATYYHNVNTKAVQFGTGQGVAYSSRFYGFDGYVKRTVRFSQPDGICTIDGTDYAMDTSTKADVLHTSGTMKMCLFAASSYNNVGYRPLAIRLWSFKISAGGNIVFDFEPRVMDGAAVVFDRVSQTALTTLGGGTFTAGKDA